MLCPMKGHWFTFQNQWLKNKMNTLIVNDHTWLVWMVTFEISPTSWDLETERALVELFKGRLSSDDPGEGEQS